MRCGVDVELDEASEKVPTLIRTYGEFWNPEYVAWDNAWRLLGKRNLGPRSPNVNVYEERGVYVLYKNYVPVYVGKAFNQSIGYRVQSHRGSPRKGPRWDSFSWFGLRGLTANGHLRSLNRRAGIKTEALIETLEALLIVVIDPRLNSRREKLKGAVKLYQSLTDKPVDQEQRLANIESAIEKLAERMK
jgi:hypothetical protein